MSQNLNPLSVEYRQMNPVTDLLYDPLVRRIEDRGILLRTGLGDLSETTIRVGTMGAIDPDDVLRLVEALRDALVDASFEPPEDGLPHARAILE